MKTLLSDVTSKLFAGVLKAEHKEYETWDEVKSDIGEAKGLELLNVQVKTNAMNQVRAAATGKPTKAALREKAFGLLTEADFKSCIGDGAKLNALIEQKVQQLEAEAVAKAQASAVPADPTKAGEAAEETA